METIRSGNLDKQWHLFSRLAAPLDRTSLQLEMKQSQDTRQYGAKFGRIKTISDIRMYKDDSDISVSCSNLEIC